MTPEQVATYDEELTRLLDPGEREAFLLFELHRAPLREVASARGLSVADAGRLIEDARNRLGLTSDSRIA